MNLAALQLGYLILGHLGQKALIHDDVTQAQAATRRHFRGRRVDEPSSTSKAAHGRHSVWSPERRSRLGHRPEPVHWERLLADLLVDHAEAPHPACVVGQAAVFRAACE